MKLSDKRQALSRRRLHGYYGIFFSKTFTDLIDNDMYS